MPERAKQYWDTKSPCAKKRVLLAFVEQPGYDCEALLKNAMKHLAFDRMGFKPHS